MNWLKTIVAASSVAIIGSVASASTVNLLSNGSFEEGVVELTGTGGSSWVIQSGVSPWEGTPTMEVQSDGTLGNIDAHHGDYYVELVTNGVSGFFQDVAVDAGSYVLSFFYSPRVKANLTDNANDMSYEINGFNNDHSLLSNVLFETVEGAPNAEYPRGAWKEVKSYFTVDEAQTLRISFDAIGEGSTAGCGNCGALIDSVSLAAVPLPAGVLLMLSALGAFGFARRRTQA